jgi:hypothetical protein
VTLGRLFLAWLPVAAWFALAAAAGWLVKRRRIPEGAAALPAPFTPWSVGWLAAEAVALTLFASLWFDSLGSGGWVVLFGLVGFLAGFPNRMRQTPWAAGPIRRLMVGGGMVDVARYVVGGAILAWRLG